MARQGGTRRGTAVPSPHRGEPGADALLANSRRPACTPPQWPMFEPSPKPSLGLPSAGSPPQGRRCCGLLLPRCPTRGR
ncbi:hypothetical protein E2562_000635 [Oryza meyeriana var. granulata]|uniref:Uncharacterized protein n=1 Tax=Oryza meyeriana var. granulata TaxID=110450 RepID=A0A6G1DT44_9ORYZ|nr:hypothetical protein E2562_000635 [Oryza meyeriana var. granulata]